MIIEKEISISALAQELGLSKSTVSRALSGKGRISEETKERINQYIAENNYHLSNTSKEEMSLKVRSIGVALPTDTNMVETPFFQACLTGICEVAVTTDYDVMVTLIKESDITLLKKMVEHKKVEGIILTRNLVDDLSIQYLKEVQMPFVLVGSCEEEGVIQVDSNHSEACEKLVSMLIRQGERRFALVAGDRRHMVNRYRCAGFYNALSNHGIAAEADLIFLDVTSQVLAEQAVIQAVQNEAGCIVCTDDVLCERVISKLNEKGYSIPRDIRVVSLYDSMYMKTNNPPITSIGVDIRQLGAMAGRRLIEKLNGEGVPLKTTVSYEIHMRQSTI